MLNLILDELRREVQLWWAYKFNAVLEITIYSVVFVLLMQIFQNIASQSGVMYGRSRQAASIIGVLVWHLCMRTMAQLSNSVTEESDVGTLETIGIMPIPLIKLFVARSVAISIMRGLQTFVMALIIVKGLQLTFDFSLIALVVILLTLAGACGFGIAFAGITLVYKRAANAASLVAMLSLFISGALVPINSWDRIFAVLKFVLPPTWGVDILRRIMLFGENVHYDVVWLFLQMFVMLGVGIGIFNIGLLRAKKDATLSIY